MSWLDDVPDAASVARAAEEQRARAQAEHRLLLPRAVADFSLLSQALVRSGHPPTSKITVHHVGEFVSPEPGWLIRIAHKEVDGYEGTWIPRAIKLKNVECLVATASGGHLVATCRRTYTPSNVSQLQLLNFSPVTGEQAFTRFLPVTLQLRGDRVGFNEYHVEDGLVWRSLDESLKSYVKHYTD